MKKEMNLLVYRVYLNNLKLY